MSQKTKKRFRFTFSLRVFLAVLTAIAVWLGWLIPRAQSQKRAVDWIQSNGGSVFYRYQTNDAGDPASGTNPQLPGPKLLRHLLGIDYFATVDSVYLNKQPVYDLQPIASLTRLRRFEMSNRDGKLTDISALAKLTKLEYIYLGHHPVSDISSLERLKRLRRFKSFATEIDNVSVLGSLPKLEEIMLVSTKVTNLEPLTGLKNLKDLNITASPISDDQFTKLQSSLPDCNITR